MTSLKKPTTKEMLKKPTAKEIQNQLDSMNEIQESSKTIIDNNEQKTELEVSNKNEIEVSNTNLPTIEDEIQFETVNEQMKYEIIVLEDINQFLIGYYIGTILHEKYRLHLFQQNENTIKAMFDSYVLNDILPKYEGCLLKVTYLGLKKTKNGYSIRNYKIAVAK